MVKKLGIQTLCPIVDMCGEREVKCDFYHTLEYWAGFTMKIPNNTEATRMSKKKQSGEPELKGTFISVMAVGIIIVVMWFAAYGLYVYR